MIDRILGELQQNKERAETGKMNAIPFPFERFSTVLPGVERGKSYGVTANSKVGKTQAADFLFMLSPYLHYLRHGENQDFRLKIFYFSLEVSKEEKMKQLISFLLYLKKNKFRSPVQLESKFKDYILEDWIVEFIKNEKKFFDEFKEVVEFDDENRNPFGIYKKLRKFAHENGVYKDSKGNVLDMDAIEKGDRSVTTKIDRYEPNDPNLYTIVIIDHISLISAESGKSKYDSMAKLSNTYLLHARDRWKFTPVIIQQQAADQEKQMFTNTGQSVKDKLKPSPDGLADNKTIGRDLNYILGLFSPARYGFKEHEGYNLSRLKDSHRELSLIFSRHSGGMQAVQLFFLGAVNHFQELPKEMHEETYQTCEKLLNLQKNQAKYDYRKQKGEDEG